MEPKQFSIIWAVIAFFFCLFPLIIYLIVYALPNDQMGFINVSGGQPASALGAAGMTSQTGQLAAPQSPDGDSW
jgi:hypothetical protein